MTSSVAAPSTHPGQTGGGGRPCVAFIHLVPTPYWLHLHRRLERELPEVELHSLYTHDVPDQPWSLDAAADVRPVHFGKGEGVESKSIALSAPREFGRAGRIIRWLKEHRVRFVVLYGYNDAGRLRILRWCRRNSIPCLLSSDSNVKLDRATGVKRIIKRILVGGAVRSAWGAMPFGTAGAAYYRKYGARADRIYRVPGEPDYAVIEGASNAEIEAARERFNIRAPKRHVLFCGRLIELKRLDTLIDAFNAVADDRPDWNLVIVGDGPLKNELRARVRPDLAERVIWAGFIGDSATIAAVYRACDVLVLPSRFDQWALVVNEAVAAGLALITSDVVGASDDLLRPGVNGFTFPAGDADALAAALLKVTAAGEIDAYKAGSRDVIAEWRRTSDPVQGVRRVLLDAGVIGGAAAAGRDSPDSFI
jgi:glycosyltransferase involved in cell wall biosynthesis